MKRDGFIPAVVAGLVCLALAFWPTENRFYFTVVFAGLSACALVALARLEKPWRWLALVSFLFGLAGIYLVWHSRLPSRPITNANQMKLAGASVWIQWSSAQGGNDHWYGLTPSATDWDTAEKLAVSWGGTLATITSPQEQNFIDATFLKGGFEHLPLWIGLVRTSTNAPGPGASGRPNRLVHVGPLTFPERVRLALWDLGLTANPRSLGGSEFSWVTGEDFDYSNWKMGEPSGPAGIENWVAINWEYSDNPPRGMKGDWNDAPLNGTTHYGGNTSGPYFGLVEIGQPVVTGPTPPKWALITLVALALAAGILFLFTKLWRRDNYIASIVS